MNNINIDIDTEESLSPIDQAEIIREIEKLGHKIHFFTATIVDSVEEG